MGKSGVYVEGLRELQRKLEQAGVDVAELKDVMARVADTATRVMQPLIPSRAGKLRASARGNRAKAKAVVTVGRATVPYAGVIAYGWKRRNIRPAKFVERTDEVMGPRVVELLEDGWAEIVERNGL